MQVTHNNIVITYNEGDNIWEFELRNRDRTAPSLKEAKAAIDRPVREKSDSFEPTRGWFVHWSGNEVKEATATSEARSRYGCTPMLRVTIQGKSQQINKRDFYPLTESNAAVVDRLRALQQEIDLKMEERRKVHGLLKGLE